MIDVGTINKALFPGLRIGYAAGAADLATGFHRRTT
jgi:DNA-binding transcriptional MocR family regulator